MTLKLITEAAAAPLTLTEVKEHLHVTDTGQDNVLTIYLNAACAAAEHQTGRRFLTQTWEAVYDAFPAAEIELAHPPVTAIVSLKYLDGDGIQQTLDAANYTLDADTMPGWVLPVAGYSWPATADSANAVRVRFTCGYVADVTGSVPKALASARAWMLLHIGAQFRDREAYANSGRAPAELPGNFFQSLLDPLRVYS
jgi:uncharacterized phiE125 gp8 family phage protein